MLYLGIKYVNVLLTTVWSFFLTFVLVRVLSLSDYAVVAVITGLGGYVLSANLGFSSVVYNRVRASFLSGNYQGSEIALTSLLIYGAVALAATLIAAVWILGSKVGSPDIRLAVLIHFIGMTCGLPWTIVKASATGLNNHFRFELIEVARRGAALILVACIYFGLPFTNYAWIILATWVIAFLLAMPLISKAWSDQEQTVLTGLRHLGGQMKLVGSTGLFSALESVIYNFPYLFVPHVWANPVAVVSFDTLYKIDRFGATAYLAAAEAVLPQQTAAVHGRDLKRLMKPTLTALIVGAAPAICGILAVTVFGDLVFGILLGKAELIAQPVRIAMAIMLAAMLFQTVAGTLLLNLGLASDLVKVTWPVIIGMTGLSVAAVIWRFDFSAFFLGYALIFLAGSVAYAVRASLSVRSLMRRPDEEQRTVEQ